MEDYFNDVAEVKKYFNEQEKNQKTLIKDAVMKYNVFFISLIRNLQYDVEKISKRLEQLDCNEHTRYLLPADNDNTIMLTKINFNNYI